MVEEIHINLLVEYRNGRPLKEPVHVAHLQANQYKLLYSPGLVQGIAAGDIFELINTNGEFNVISRSGNVSVQVYFRSPVLIGSTELIQQVEALNGSLDGSVQIGMVFSIPVSAGFEAIETIFNTFTNNNPEAKWFYGNVYDVNDNPLLWWE